MTQQRDLQALAREMRGRTPLRASLLLLALLAFCALAVVWAALTEIDDVTRAEGRIVPSGAVQVIEAAETGILQALHVQEGQIVAKDALLMELDGTLLTSQLNQEQQRAFGLMARIERLQAEIGGKPLVLAPIWCCARPRWWKAKPRFSTAVRPNCRPKSTFGTANAPSAARNTRKGW